MSVRSPLAVAAAAALAAASALGPAWASAQDPSGAATAAPPAGRPAPDPAGAPTAASGGKETGDDSWLDVGHSFIERRIFSQLLRVDRFFSDDRDLEPERARSFFRWRQELHVAERLRPPGYTTSVALNLKFPGVNKQLRRLQLEVSGQSRDAFTALFPGDRPSPGDVATPVGQGFRTADAGLGYDLFESLTSVIATHGDLGAGVILGLPPGGYVRARLRFAESPGWRLLARQAVTGFWRTDTLFGSTASGELERPLRPETLARLSASATVTERSRGLEWGADLALIAALRARVGAQLGFGVVGATRGPVGVEAYRYYLRLRRDVYRKWIFVEVAPEYGWPWTPERGRHGVWAVALRLEVQFRGVEPPRLPPSEEPESPPEPEDPGPAEERARGALPAGPGPR